MTHKEVHLASHPVIGLVLQVGDAEKFSIPGFFFFSESESRVQMSQPQEDGGNKRLVVVQLELACEADGLAPPDPV